MKQYIFDVVETDDGTGDLAVQLSDEFCKEENWQVGDTIEWVDNKDGTYSMVNKTKETRK